MPSPFPNGKINSMDEAQIEIRCQRCGAQMSQKDPLTRENWPAQQFWECPECGRHFWTTYPPPKPPKPAATT